MTQNLEIISRIVAADLETPVGLYLKIRDLYPESALLESSDYHTSQNSVSYIGVHPIASFTVNADTTVAKYPGGNTVTLPVTCKSQVMQRLKEYIGSFNLTGEPLNDANGFFGYTAYDCVRYFDKVDITKPDKELHTIPDMKYVLYKFVICVNHFKNQMAVYEHLIPGEASGIDELLSIIRNNNVAQYPFQTVGDATSSITDDQYIAMVKKGISHAMRGDVFQIVLSRRFRQAFKGDEFNVYRALRCVNPSPYLFYFDFGDFRIFGSSPETHLRVEGNHAYIDPIAGTFRRTGDDRHDRELAQALLADTKENAEHIMLVDLARNDLSRSGGEVGIEFLKQIQYYSHVIHMVSRVSATLPEDADVYSLYAATFPAGTLSGAPKVRAMQLIDEIEPHNRLIYGGCIGFIGFNGNINHAITIRSFLSHGGNLYSQAGAGIVAHSVPENELQETNNKLGALVNAVKYAETFGH
ncbi:MAG: anthranilate synthase component I family protein [Muribaculum sp.]|nr:anthranilate synthase component I family protein [Muribaculum sp.]